MRRVALCPLFRGAPTPRARPPVARQRALAAHAPETRCAHCFVTFATAAELAHHAAHFCFPDRPEEVLARFPPGAAVVDTVRGSAGEVLGAASNPGKRHAAVAVRRADGLVADVPISRLRRRPPRD